MNSEVQAAKRTIRNEIQHRVRAQSLAEHRSGSQKICQRILSLPAWKKAKFVLLFAPFQGEPNIWPVISSALKAGKVVTLPKLAPSGSTYFASEVNDLDRDLAPGKFGILEPQLASAAMAMDRLDFILIPGVAFDAHGNRLGRGRGYYDRLLADVGGVKCGVAFDEQVLEKVPTGPGDVQLDCVVTPTRWIKCK